VLLCGVLSCHAGGMVVGSGFGNGGCTIYECHDKRLLCCECYLDSRSPFCSLYLVPFTAAQDPITSTSISLYFTLLPFIPRFANSVVTGLKVSVRLVRMLDVGSIQVSKPLPPHTPTPLHHLYSPHPPRPQQHPNSSLPPRPSLRPFRFAPRPAI